MSRKRICICCGNEYEYCPHCGDYKNKPRWMMNYDDEGCHVAFQTVSDYLNGEITKEAATEVLKNANLSYRSQYIESVAKYVDELLDGKVVTKETAVPAPKSAVVENVNKTEEIKDTNKKEEYKENKKIQNSKKFESFESSKPLFKSNLT